MHGFILSAAVAGEGFVKRFRLLLRFHTSPALLRSRRGRREKRALRRKVIPEYAGAGPAVKGKCTCPGRSASASSGA
jgi:hypothetical protein